MQGPPPPLPFFYYIFIPPPPTLQDLRYLNVPMQADLFRCSTICASFEFSWHVRHRMLIIKPDVWSI